MAYLIDGSNFLGYESAQNIRDPQSKYRLVARLSRFQRQKKTRILIVFDGTADPILVGEDFRRKSFSVIFPSWGENADDIIKDIISKQTDLRRFFVVSSDREIRSFARRKGAKLLNCKEFDRELKVTLKKYRKYKEMMKKEPSLSPLEINQWLKTFKDKK